jgi:hypothetical protein
VKASFIHTPGNVRAFVQSRRVPFTHMGPADTKVWKAALAANLFPADRYEYDIKLGGLTPTGIPLEDPHVEMWATLTKKRVDVLAWRGKQPWFIEVKPVGSFAALGQCLGYGYLGKKERPELSSVRLAVVCAICDRDLKPCFEAYGVEVIELPLSVAEVLLTRCR